MKFIKELIVEKKGNISDNFFWSVVEDINWPLSKKGYEKAREALINKYTKEENISIKNTSILIRKELKIKLEEHAILKTGNRYGYYGLGDDSFWDLTAHIVGLGKKHFLEVKANPELAKIRADNRAFIENFEYCLPNF